MWNYYWGYTIAQIELLASDAPLIVYNNDKKGKGTQKPKANDIINAKAKWQEKYQSDNNTINIDISDFK